VADAIKSDSASAIAKLKEMGLKVVMLTGDNELTANEIGRLAGVHKVIAGVKPDEKAKVIEDLKKEGKVLMVGDGINDAPALVSADMGFAIGAGTDVAIDSADVVLMKSRLSDVVTAIKLSKKTIKNIYENLFWAFIYNIIGIPLAAGVYISAFGWTLNPMFGAFAMSLSSFCVVTNALRLNLFKKDDIAEYVSSDKKNGQVNIGNIPISNDDFLNKEKKNNKGDEKMNKTIKIEGMMCGHCEASVKKALESLEGVDKAEVSHVTGEAIVSLSSDVDNEILKHAVEAKDYKVLDILA
jgi:Cu2+-exporting ATPase